ncbi:MAG: prepilin peptidase [Ardenticatenaceae bacterium]|nr:prepilin peptidase [Ardenticatenaceae bacterium]MCB8988258.1 prepilin peptidase [Ardenticatenaceae bacterium]
MIEVISLWLAGGFLIGWLLYWLSDFLPRRLRKAAPSAYTSRWTTVIQGAVGGLTAVCFLYFGPRQQWPTLVIYAFFLLIALIDAKYRLVLNVLVYPALALVLSYQITRGPQVWTAVLLGGGLAFAAFMLAAWLRPGDLGGGDIKLSALIGLLFGFPALLWPLLIGVAAGGLAAGFLLLRGYGRRYHIPYAPFLCLGVLIALFYNPI